MRRLIAVLRRNPLAEAFTDARGVIRPIRRSEGYSEEIVRERARQRQATGQTAREQQDVARFERFLTRSEGGPRRRVPREDPEEQLYRLEREREALREALAESPASEYVELVGEHGTARGALGLIPMEVARRYLPRPPEHYRTARVRRAGHDYLRREYVLDELADSLGYRDSRDFEEALQQAIRDRRRLAALDSEIRKLERSTRRRNPTGPSVLTRFLRWLKGG